MSVLGISPVSSIQRACEQIAHHIIVNEVGGAGHVNNVNAICEMFRINRRNFYNLVKKLADDNIIEHLESRRISRCWTSLEIRYNYGEIENIGYENNQALNYVIIRK